MRTRTTAALVAVAAMGLAAACGKSPTSPSSNGSSGSSRSLSSVTIGGGTSVSQGDTAQLTATAQYSDSTTQTVTNQATWSSSNPSVATVSATGLLTALGNGAVDITATYQNVPGRRTVQISAARYSLRVDVGGFTALGTCDNFTQGLTEGEFATSVQAIFSDGTTDTLSQTREYPGNPDNLFTHHLQQGERDSSVADKTYTLNGEPGEFLRIRFRATEWDQQIVVIPPSTRWIPDSNMNNRSDSQTHSFTNGSWSNTGPNSITLGSGSCAIRLDYTLTATRR